LGKGLRPVYKASVCPRAGTEGLEVGTDTTREGITAGVDVRGEKSRNGGVWPNGTQGSVRQFKHPRRNAGGGSKNDC